MVKKTATDKHAQYACSKCGKKPSVGDDLYITKIGDNWVSCIDPECFKSQGGKIEDENKPKFFPKGGTNYKKPEDCDARLAGFHEFIINTGTQLEIVNRLVKNKIFENEHDAYVFIVEKCLEAYLGDLKPKS